MEARTGFVASGVALDVAAADAIAQDWQSRDKQETPPAVALDS